MLAQKVPSENETFNPVPRQLQDSGGALEPKLVTDVTTSPSLVCTASITSQEARRHLIGDAIGMIFRMSGVAPLGGSVHVTPYRTHPWGDRMAFRCSHLTRLWALPAPGNQANRTHHLHSLGVHVLFLFSAG